MKVYKNIIVINIFIMFFSIKVSAAVASYEVHTKQQYGKTFEVVVKGDEKFNYVVDNKNSYILVYKGNKWDYGKFKNGKIVSSNVEFLSGKVPKDCIKESDETFKQYLNVQYEKKKKEETIEKEKKEIINYKSPLKLITNEIPTLVVLVEYNDAKIEHNWENTFFSENGNTINNYFNSVFNKRLILTKAEETQGKNNGIVKICKDYNHPEFYKNYENQNKKIREEAVKIIKDVDQYVDFKLYDKNNNKLLDQNELIIYFIFAGYESSLDGAKNKSIWSNQYNFYDESQSDYVKADNVQLNLYSCSGEKQNEFKPHKTTIGVILHEIGHLLGLPDLYDTMTNIKDENSSVMGVGLWNSEKGLSGDTPKKLSSWSVVKIGLKSEKVIKSDNKKNKLTKNTVLRLNTQSDKQYFLIENIDGNIVILHINENFSKNYKENERLVLILENKSISQLKSIYKNTIDLNNTLLKNSNLLSNMSTIINFEIKESKNGKKEILIFLKEEKTK